MRKSFSRLACIGAFLGSVLAGVLAVPVLREIPAWAQNVACYMDQGGAGFHLGSGCTQTVESGGIINIASGGAFKIAGTDRTTALTTSPAAIAAGYKLARGQSTTVAASDTIASGLATVVAVVCSYDTDVADANSWVTCSIGDQAGTPVAGSFLLKTWQNTSGNDPTPAAAGSFSKKVNWIAVGT